MDSPGGWGGFEESLRFFEAIRPRIEAATGARACFSWFFRMDPQVALCYGTHRFVVERYGEAIRQLEWHGDELGLHVHAWRWSESERRWVVDHGDPEWIGHCLRTSFDAYRSAFGRPCVSIRFGDRWMDDRTLDMIESLGMKYDLTAEPGRRARPSISPGELHTGSLPDYAEVPRRPYVPSREDFRVPCGEKGRDLWMIPLSTAREPGRFAGLKNLARTLGVDLRRRNEPIPLDLCVEPTVFGAMANELLTTEGASYLALVVRADSCLRTKSGAAVERNVNFLLSHPMASRFRFVRPADAISLLVQPACG